MVETVVAISVVAVLIILASLAFPSGGCFADGQLTQSLSNIKQLHLATQQMALDSTTTGDTNLGWPGDMSGSFSRWAAALVRDNYLVTNDLCKLLSAPGKVAPLNRIPSQNANGILIYAVSGNSSSNTVFASSANFTNSPTGGSAPTADAKPYGNKGFIVFRKAGDGAILQARFAGQTNVIGSYVPLCK